MKKSIIFVSGVHGVGKTTFIKQLSKKISLNYYSSSDLIKRYNTTLDFPDKKIDNVDKNQNALLQSIKLNINEKCFILDGHFVLLDTSNRIIDIPLETFEELNICKIILLTLDSKIIMNRLKKRNDKTLDLNVIERLQQREVSRAKSISLKLGINLTHLSNEYSIKKFINSKNKEVM